jgi:hypothetical protein
LLASADEVAVRRPGRDRDRHAWPGQARRAAAV